MRAYNDLTVRPYSGQRDTDNFRIRFYAPVAEVRSKAAWRPHNKR
jgi:hypothetical protein